jgi:hypothetical protein
MLPYLSRHTDQTNSFGAEHNIFDIFL